VTLQANASFGTAPYTYAWDLTGSGQYTTVGQTVSELIPDTNTYKATVRVTDATGAVAIASKSVKGTPVPAVAQIASSLYLDVAGQGVTFQGSASSVEASSNAAGLTYIWNFGDGSPLDSGTSLTNPSHIYATPGNYTVQLTVSDVHGLVSAPVTATVEVTPAYVINTGANLIPDFGANPTIVSVASGNWSNPSTWSGDRLPTTGDIVDILAGTDITYDEDNLTTAYNTLEIQSGGTLQFRTDINTGLLVGNFEVLAGGTLQIGTAAQPVAPNVTATVMFANQAINTAIDPRQFGTGLIAMGTVTIYGSVKTPFVPLAVEPHAGDTTLTLATPVQGWLPGDELVLPDTREITDGMANTASELETVTVASVSPNGTVVTLTAPLQYDHLGARDGNGNLVELPQVADETRNVVIQSQSGGGTRGTVIFTDRANVNVNYANFLKLGRTTNAPIDDTEFNANLQVTHIGTNQQDRSPVVFLDLWGPLTPQADGYQYSFVGNVVTCPMMSQVHIWGIEDNGSSYGLIEGNFVNNWAGAGIALVSGSEINNTIEGNFVISIVGDGSPGDGLEGAGFWFRGPDNYVTNNVTSDTPDSFGFEYFMEYLGDVNVAAYPGDDIVLNPQSGVIKDMNATPILSFIGNQSYGVTLTGLSYYWLGTVFDTPDGSATSTFKNFSAWNVNQYGVYAYQSNNVTLDGLKAYNDPTKLVGTLELNAGVNFSDYYTGNFTLTNSDIEGFRFGTGLPVYSVGVQTISNTYFRDATDVLNATLWNISASIGWLPPRATYLINDDFNLQAPTTAPSLTMTAIDMEYNAVVGGNVAQSDQLFVVNYNDVIGDSFQVYYVQQDANFIMPQTILNSDGTDALLGAPVAGLTNAQAWAQYGVAVAGAVAPSTSRSWAGINGLIN
jgi:PKD repeat protein